MGHLSYRKPATSKLKLKDVFDIKNEQEKLIKRLAKTYGMSATSIRNILTERTWRQIKIKKVS